MKTTKNLLFLYLVISIFLVGFISAANVITIVTPAANDVIDSSTYYVNATLDTNALNLTSAHFFYNDGTSNTTIETVGNFTLLTFNCTWDTTGLVDVDDLEIWVNITNSSYTTDFTGSLDSSLGVDIDNGVPTCAWASSSLQDQSSFSRSTDSFTLTTDADSTIGISSGTLYIASTTDSVTTAANACSEAYTPASFANMLKGSAYPYILGVTDGNGNQTNCTSRTVVYRDAGAIGGADVGEEEPTGIAAFGDTIRTGWSNFWNGIIAFINKIIGK